MFGLTSEWFHTRNTCMTSGAKVQNTFLLTQINNSVFYKVSLNSGHTGKNVYFQEMNFSRIFY